MNDIQQSLIDSILTLSQKTVDDTSYDQTVKATIIKCYDYEQCKYKISYDGGHSVAYSSTTDAVYAKSDSVYVLIPNCHHNKKIIIGYTDIDTVSENNDITSNYTILTANPIETKYLHLDFDNMGSIYGRWDNPIDLIDNSYYEEKNHISYVTLYNSSSESNILSINEEELSTLSEKSEEVLFEVYLKACVIAQDDFGFILTFENNEGQNAEYRFAANEMKNITYNSDYSNYWNYYNDDSDLSNSNMEYQYKIFNIGSVQKLCSIKIYYNSNFNNSFIAFTNLSLRGVEENIQSDKYSMSIDLSEGSTLSENCSSITVYPKTYYDTVDATDDFIFYWGKEDGETSSSDEYYNQFLGEGYYYLQNGSSLTINDTIAPAASNNFICVGSYKDKVFLKQIFTIYNNIPSIGIIDNSSVNDNLLNIYLTLTNTYINIIDRSVDNLDEELTAKERNEAIAELQQNEFKLTELNLIQENNNIICTINNNKKSISGCVYKWSAGYTKNNTISIDNLTDNLLSASNNILTIGNTDLNNYNAFKCSVWYSNVFIGSASILI